VPKLTAKTTLFFLPKFNKKVIKNKKILGVVFILVGIFSLILMFLNNNKQKQAPPSTNYRVTVENNTFKIFKDDQFQDMYKYKNSKEISTLLYIEKEQQFFHKPDTVLFYANSAPAGCESTEDIACLTYLGSILKEFDQYGGVWKINLNTKQLTHLFSIPNKEQTRTQINTFKPSENGNSVTLSLTFYFRDGSNQNLNFIIDIVSGKFSPL
jgi:uncharacterized glyoxalase superfamily protein PhnB